MTRVRASAEERLWRRTERGTTDECWLWQGGLNRHGYGTINLSGRPWLVHRFSYLLAHPGKDLPRMLDHKCHTTECDQGVKCSHRRCVNPNHLQPTTLKENNFRGNSPTAHNKRKTHCIRGHAFAGSNLVILKNGWRVCRTCVRLRDRQLRANRRRIYCQIKE